MFPEHWERGTGTGNVEHHFVKSWYEGVYLFRMFQSEMEHVPSVMGTMFPERCFETRNVFQNMFFCFDSFFYFFFADFYLTVKIESSVKIKSNPIGLSFLPVSS
jgi:hypothetical protein